MIWISWLPEAFDSWVSLRISFVCLKSDNDENMIIMMSIWNNEALKGEKSYLDAISLDQGNW